MANFTDQEYTVISDTLSQLKRLSECNDQIKASKNANQLIINLLDFIGLDKLSEEYRKIK